MNLSKYWKKKTNRHSGAIAPGLLAIVRR